MIAEDDLISRSMLQTLLKNWGHEVICADNGAEAWRLFQNREFAMVISDWMMPELDGLQLVRRIRSGLLPTYIYIILLTGKSKKDDVVLGLEAGADDLITKPFDADELRARVRAGERIVQLEQSLARQNEELAAANATVRLANDRIRGELELAANLQRALLPSSLTDITGVDFAWAFRPCDELAGDCLNVFRLDEKAVGLYVLDVSGHGVAAALLSVTLSRLLFPTPGQSSLTKKYTETSPGYRVVPPVEVADRLNRQFVLDRVTEQYFTLLYGILNLERGEFRYVCAGHPGPVHVALDAKPVIVKTCGWPIGVVEDAAYEEHAIRLCPGDRLYLYSDGIMEARNPNSGPFGNGRLIDTLHHSRATPLTDSVSSLVANVEQWCEPANPDDDMSVLALEMP